MGDKRNYTVIVSNKCRRFIAALDFGALHVHYPQGLREQVFDFLRDNQGRRFNLLLLLEPSEALEFHDLFNTFDPRRLNFAFILFSSEKDDAQFLPHLQRVLDLRTSTPTDLEFQFLLKKAQDYFTENHPEAPRIVKDRRLADQHSDELALISIGKALSLERDPDKLLRTILYLSKKITGADAGSLYLVQGTREEPYLRFKYSHTFSKSLSYEEFSMPIDEKSIAGYVASTGKTLNIPDVYNLDASSPFGFNSSFDKTHGYRTRSMLVVPMVNHLGVVIGVIQLINCKEAFDRIVDFSGNEAFEVVLKDPQDFEDLVVPFEARYLDLMEAVASQAAIAIENNRMILQIEKQFEEFVKASVTAIESRDPATSGHSFRVAQMALAIAQEINNTHEGPLAEVFFSPTALKELNFASLLHDFGKVYIDLEIFMKSKKLYPKDLEILKMRLAALYRSIELDHAKKEIEDLRRGIEPSEGALQLRNADLEKVKQLWAMVLKLNEPTVQAASFAEDLLVLEKAAGELGVVDLEGNRVSLFSENDLANLRIPRGSLNDAERAVIQSHVVHTFNFVKNIPWPDEYKDIPEIASKHHEMLDGSGYPWQLTAEDIPLGARIMAVSDVFDALAASDRPYKKALPMEKILGILRDEAEKGKLDKDIVDLVINRQLYEITGRWEHPSSNLARKETP